MLLEKNFYITKFLAALVIILFYNVGQGICFGLSTKYNIDIGVLFCLNSILFIYLIIKLDKQVPFFKIQLKQLGFFCLLYILCLSINALLNYFFFNPIEQAQNIEKIVHNSGKSLSLFIFIVLLAPIIEELLFRHLLISHLKKIFSNKITLLLSTAIFAIFHFESSFLVTITIFNLGFLMSYTYLKSNGNLFYSIILHCINNLLAYLTVFL